LTDEGRTRSKNAFRRFCAYAVVMFLVAGAGGYVIYRYWVSTTFSTLLAYIYMKTLDATIDTIRRSTANSLHGVVELSARLNFRSALSAM